MSQLTPFTTTEVVYTRLMATSTAKARLRKVLLEKRKAVSLGVWQQASVLCAERCFGVLDWGSTRRICIYKTRSDLREIDTDPLVQWLRRVHPHIDIVQPEQHIFAPFPSGEFCGVFVPVVGFDRGGFRLGMGGGWYDRWLSGTPPAKVIGLAYDWAYVENVAKESHDIPLNIVITPTQLYTF